MLKQLTTVSLAAAALALPAPAAHADHATYDCLMAAVAEETTTGSPDSYVGVAHGFVASPTLGEALSIRCTVEVDGTEVASTPTGSGTQTATASGVVYFTASDTQDVKVCTVWTAGWESGQECYETSSSPIPPQEFRDLVATVLQAVDDAAWIVRPLLCPVLGVLDSSIGGGTVEIDRTGDVRVLGATVFDCPPFGDPGPEYPDIKIIRN